jgi:hypothetical protein
MKKILMLIIILLLSVSVSEAGITKIIRAFGDATIPPPSGTYGLSGCGWTGDGTSNRSIGSFDRKPGFVFVESSSYNTDTVVRLKEFSSTGSIRIYNGPFVGGYDSTGIKSFSGSSFSIGSSDDVNKTGVEFRCAGFTDPAESTGVNIAIGSYIGNGTGLNESKTITLSFEPVFVYIISDALPGESCASNAAWYPVTNLYRTKNMTLIQVFEASFAGYNSNALTLSSTGFTVTDNGNIEGCYVNNSGTDYFYIAVGETSGFIDYGSYTGDGTSSHSITGVGFSPTWVMVFKDETNTSISTREIFRNDYDGADYSCTIADDITGRCTSVNNLIRTLDSDGFTVGSSTYVNQSGITYFYLAVK